MLNIYLSYTIPGNSSILIIMYHLEIMPETYKLDRGKVTTTVHKHRATLREYIQLSHQIIWENQIELFLRWGAHIRYVEGLFFFAHMWYRQRLYPLQYRLKKWRGSCFIQYSWFQPNVNYLIKEMHITYLFRFGYHHVGFKKGGLDFIPETFDDWMSKGDVGYEVAVHNVKV